MLIPLSSLGPINPKGIIHVGAHTAEELDAYNERGIKHVIWIEANPSLIPQLVKKVDKFGHKVICEAVNDIDDQVVKFNITNNVQSSSLLELGTHKVEHPHIFVEKTIQVRTRRLDTIINESKVDMTQYDFLNLDIQGVELNAIKSLGIYLDQIKYIYTEVNKAQLYDGCNLVDDMTNFLSSKGFKLITISWTQYGWGDAFYSR